MEHKEILLKILQKLCCVKDYTTVLEAIAASTAEAGIDFELAMVVDANEDYFQIVYQKDEETGVVTTTYVDAEGNIAVPVAPIEFVQSNALLATIITELQELTEQKTPTSVNTTGAGAVPIGASEVSIFNTGLTDATVNGVALPSGIVRTFGFKNEIDTAIAYDGGGTNLLLIDYMI